MNLAIGTLQNLVDSFPSQGDHPAIITLTRDGRQTTTFSQLRDTSHRVAAGLTQEGLSPGCPVVLFAPNQTNWVMAICAIIEAGGIPVPIDSQMQGDDLKHVLLDCGAQWIFTTTHLEPSLHALNLTNRLHLIFLDADKEHPQSWQHYVKDTETVFSKASPDDQAVLFYTSGTSGRPKGVPLTHANLVSNLDALLTLDVINKNDRLLVPLPLHHVYPFMIGLLAPLSVGIPLVMPFSLTGPQLLRALRETHPTAIIGIPRLYEALVSALEKRLRQEGAFPFALLRLAFAISTILARRIGIRVGQAWFAALHKRISPQLHTLVSGGAPLEPDLAWKLEGLGWRVGTGYGLTETSPILTLNKPGSGHFDTAGQPLTGINLKIAVSQDDDEQGEVLVKGPNVFSGYFHLPEKNKTAFTKDGYFRTGDIGKMKGEFLQLVGRASSMIVLPGGENIRPDFIEDQLNQGTHIQETGVLQVNDKLVAVIVPRAGIHGERDKTEIQGLIKEEVSRQSHQLPSHHHLANYALSFDPLPRTRLGKLRRHLLQSLYEQAREEGSQSLQNRGPLAIERMSPEDQHLLSHPQGKQTWDWLCTRFKNFPLRPDTNIRLDLGVDSLEWVNLSLELREAVELDFDQNEISEIQTVRDLLQVTIDAESASGLENLSDQLRNPDTLLDVSQRQWLGPQCGILRRLGSLLFRANRLFMQKIYGLTIYGLEHLPQKGPLVIVANHVSLLDPLAIAATFSDKQLVHTYWGGWTGMMFTNPLTRAISRATRVLPIDSTKAPVSSLALGLTVLKQDDFLVWFPEGERSKEGKLHPFRSGIGFLLDAEPFPVLPAWISGTHQALPKDQWMPRRGQITVRFGAPISVKSLKENGKESQAPQQIAEALFNEVCKLSGDHSHDQSK